MSELPPGFVLDAPAAPLPAGFVLDNAGAAPVAQSSIGDRLAETWPARLAKSIYSAVTLPGDVYQGKVSMVGENGRTNPEVIGRSAELATVASPVPAATRAGVGFMGAPIPARAKPVAPTREALEAAADSGYETARGLGVEILPQPIANLGMRVGLELNEKGIQSELAPKTFSILGKLANPPANAVATVQGLEALRRSFGHAAKDFANPTEQLAARTAQSHLDDYLATLPAEDVVRGPAAEVARVLSEARGNYAAASRSGQVTGQVDDANLSAAAANSGQNLGNATRQRFKSILLSDKKSAGYSADEIAQMERVVRGTRLGNATRFTGNLLGGGGGLGSVVSAAGGAMAAGPAGAAAPAIGYALKKVSDASVNRQARALDELVRQRSPLGKKLTSENMSVPNEINPSVAAIVRLLMENQAQQ